MSKLALLGGGKTVTREIPQELFHWPIVNEAMEQGILEVLRSGNMSGTDITKKFERKFADWVGAEYGLAHSSGTASLQAAMYGLGVGVGDEIICPAVTYWASCVQALSLGASVVFADIDPETLCIAPDDLENRISDRTKVIVVVHYLAYPADMDKIMAIARKHNIKVLEDVSHAHGALYKGKMVGNIGDAAGYSLMSGKSFAIGEGGMLTTNDQEVYERAILFGQYARHSDLKLDKYKAISGLPHGGYKYRMHQMSSVIGLEQLKKYPAEIAEIDKAMNYFWDILEDVPGLRSHRPPKGGGTTKGGWYAAHGIYKSEELGGLSVKRFSEAVVAEGAQCSPGCNRALHTHPLFHSVDVYGHGRPTNLANLPSDADIRQGSGSLPVAEGIQGKVFGIPYFKKFMPEIIKEYAEAYRKVAENYKDLLANDDQQASEGSWGLTARKG
jgi:dTDP-4-amino-4,6-dideoxygalactose transaminase